MPTPAVHPAIRLLSNYSVTEGGCWVPANKPQPNGYVLIYSPQGRTTAHRVVWEWVWGRAIPDGWTADHLCRNPSCIRPDHVEPVPHRENLMRAPTSLAAMNSKKTHCPKGHPYSEENTYIKPSNGSRTCRTCQREWHVRLSAKRREERRWHAQI